MRTTTGLILRCGGFVYTENKNRKKNVIDKLDKTNI